MPPPRSNKSDIPIIETTSGFVKAKYIGEGEWESLDGEELPKKNKKEKKPDFPLDRADFIIIRNSLITQISAYKKQSEKYPNGKGAADYKESLKTFEKIKQLLGE